MPLPGRRKPPEPPRTPNGQVALVASAAKMNTQYRIARGRVYRGEWQAEAWAYYDSIGELRYAVNWKAQAARRARLVAARVQAAGQEPEPTEDPRAVEVMAAFAGGPDGQSDLLARLVIHLEVPGDAYLVGRDVVDENTGEVVGQRWDVHSTDEVTTTGGASWSIDVGDGNRIPVPDDAQIIRVWRPHPRRSWEADSPVRAVLPLLREIDGYGKHIAATVDSRLAGAGLLVLPKEITFPTAPEGDGSHGDGVGEDPFITDLTVAMVTPIRDRDHPSAVVPIVLRMPGEYIDKIAHLTFGTQFDEHAKELRADAIRRLALGLNLPPEQLLGLGDTNHWSAWQIDEAGVKTHVVPDLQLAAAAIAEAYLRPNLADMGVPDPETYSVVVDVTDLTARPNKSEEAQAAYDRYLISNEAARRAFGFDENDAPGDVELRDHLLIDLVRRGAVTSDVVQALGLPPGIVLNPSDPGSTGADGTRTAPGHGRELPDRTPPPAGPGGTALTGAGRSLAERLTSSALDALTDLHEAGIDVLPVIKGLAEPGPSAALLDACEVLVLRALEKAGQKRRSEPGGMALRDTPLHEAHLRYPVAGDGEAARLLAGAWTLAGPVADRYGVDVDRLTSALGDVTAALLSGGRRYDRTALAVALEPLCPRCVEVTA